MLKMEVTSETKITTTEMHTGGEPLRIIESGYPEIQGETILEKRKYATEKLDHLRKFLMYEPRGHFDQYGAVLVKPDDPKADLAVLFMHNAGYSTMCGHAVIALGRYAVDKGIVPMKSPETQVNIQCPCGLVKTFVDCSSGKPGSVRFHSVPAFAFDTDIEVDVKPFGKIRVDIGYGGAFYALVPAQVLGLSVRGSSATALTEAATNVSDAVRELIRLEHPDNEDLAFLYGTIITDGNDAFQEAPTENICVFANREVDRCPTGSGVTARLAVQYQRGLIGLKQRRVFRSAIGSDFTGEVIKETKCGDFNAIVAEVSGEAFYTGTCVFTAEQYDSLRHGFLLR